MTLLTPKSWHGYCALVCLLWVISPAEARQLDKAADEILNARQGIFGTWEDPLRHQLYRFYWNPALSMAHYEKLGETQYLLENISPIELKSFASLELSGDTLYLDGHVLRRTQEKTGTFPPPPGFPSNNFELFWRTVQTFYPHFATRNIDWEHLVKSAHAKLEKKTDLFRLLSSMLEEIGDNQLRLVKPSSDADYSYDHGTRKDEPTFFPPRFTKRIELLVDEVNETNGDSIDPTWLIDRAEKHLIQNVHDTYLGASLHDRDENFLWGRLKHFDSIGYLGIKTLEGIDREMLVRHFAFITHELKQNPMKALVIDLRLCHDDEDGYALELARRFIDSPRVVLTEYFYADGKTSQEKEIRIEPIPSEQRLTANRIYFLTGPMTSGSAETLLMALDGAPQVIRVGETTMGLTSAISVRHLTNGWELQVPNILRKSAKKQSYELTGLPPDIDAEFPFLPDKVDPALDAILSREKQSALLRVNEQS